MSYFNQRQEALRQASRQWDLSRGAQYVNGTLRYVGGAPAGNYQARKAFEQDFLKNYDAQNKPTTTPATTQEPSIIDTITAQVQNFQNQITQQQQAFQAQLAEQQRQAQEAQRQLMINMQRGDRAPAAVKTASSGAEQSGLTRRGTTGYFGRRGMRIGSLNVPASGLAIAPNMNQTATAGSFA